MKPSSPRVAIRYAAERSDRLLTAPGLNADPSVLAVLEREGDLRRVLHGVYVGVGHPVHRLIEGAAWTLRRPHAVIGLLTAAVYHDRTAYRFFFRRCPGKPPTGCFFRQTSRATRSAMATAWGRSCPARTSRATFRRTERSVHPRIRGMLTSRRA